MPFPSNLPTWPCVYTSPVHGFLWPLRPMTATVWAGIQPPELWATHLLPNSHVSRMLQRSTPWPSVFPWRDVAGSTSEPATFPVSHQHYWQLASLYWSTPRKRGSPALPVSWTVARSPLPECLSNINYDLYHTWYWPELSGMQEDYEGIACNASSNSEVFSRWLWCPCLLCLLLVTCRVMVFLLIPWMVKRSKSSFTFCFELTNAI